MDRRPVRAEEFIDRLPQIAVEHLHASVLRIGYGGSREWADLEQLLGILITQITARNLQKHRRIVVGHSDGAIGLSGEGEGVAVVPLSCSLRRGGAQTSPANGARAGCRRRGWRQSTIRKSTRCDCCQLSGDMAGRCA